MNDFPTLVATASLLAGIIAVTIAIIDMRRDPEPGYGWFVASIGAFVAAAVPFEPFGYSYDVADNAWAWRLPAALLVLLPALLLHLVVSLSGRDATWLVRGCDVLTGCVVLWLFAIPTLPGPHYEPAPWYYTWGLAVFLLQMLVTVILSVRMLVVAARGSTGAARLRGNLLAATLAMFGAAFLAWFLAPGPRVEFAMSMVALFAGLLLWLAMRAPRWAYLLSSRTRTNPFPALEALVSTEDVRDRLPDLLEYLTTSWGLVGLAVVDPDGVPLEAVGSCSLSASAARASRPIRVRGTNARIGVEAWTTPLTPPIRQGDRLRMTMIAHLIELALAREETARRRQAVDAASQDVEQRLLVAHDRLRQAEETRDLAARVVGDDIRTPIKALLGLTDSVETRWAELPKDQLQPLQQLVARQVARLASVVDKLFVVTSIEDGTLRSAPERIDVRRLVDSVLVSGIDAEVRYTCADSDDCCDVIVEPVALREIVTQLLDNAASHGSPDIVVQLTPADGDVLIEVLDQGTGVRDEFAPQMFDRFTRDSPKVERGLGLGLAIVDELVRSLGGEVGYRRDDFERTVFWLRLPQAAAVPG